MVTTRPARKRLRKRTINVRVTIREFELVAAWARARQITSSDVVRELIGARAAEVAADERRVVERADALADDRSAA